MAKQNHVTMTSPAPIGGLNVQDSLVAMPASDATVLRNFFSQPYGLELRRGTQRHNALLTGAVRSIVPHITADGTDPLRAFAFAGSNMYDVTEPNSAALTPLITGLANSRWADVGMSNASGFNVVCVNGSDNPIWVHDDHSLSRITLAVNPLDPQAGEIAGVDPKKFITGTIHQKRIWWVEKQSTKAWYLDPEAITGNAYLFDFGSQFTRGGRLMMVASWTRDSGVGPDDLLVAISSEGELAIYSGSDPDSVATFSLRGVFYTGAPLGDRCVATVAGDLLLLTQFGLLSMNAAMDTSDTAAAIGNQYLSNKIQFLISTLAGNLVDHQDWNLTSWPDTNMIMINVPLAGSAYSGTVTPYATLAGSIGTGQLVQSTITKGWSQFDDMPSVCWRVIAHDLYYGDADGNIWKAWEGNVDGAIIDDNGAVTGGDPIVGQVQTAFNYFGEMSTVKHAKMARPTFMGSTRIPYLIKVNSDFNYDEAVFEGSAPAIGTDVWGVGKWNEAKWKGGLSTQKAWTAVSGIGNAFAVRLIVESSTPVLWASYDMMIENGTNI